MNLVLKYTAIKAFLLVVSTFLIVICPFTTQIPENNSFLAVSASLSKSAECILLDPGHGGEDSGAIGVGGILEKDINLPVTLKTGAFLRFFGYRTEFTRRTDRMTCDEGLTHQRDRKKSDIRNRFSQLEQSDCVCFLSIHQNYFGGDAHGAQIFYGPQQEESAMLADILQNSLISLLQPENKRVIKPVTDDVYLVYHAQKVAVLAECGFLSSNHDAALLMDDTYQNKVSFVLATGTIQYLTEREVTEWEK